MCCLKSLFSIKITNIYQELAEKEHALILAAQFGKSLIEEKEELERQIENMKRDHQNQLEVSLNIFGYLIAANLKLFIKIKTYEQESYQLKRLIESIRNEYDAKIYELNEDIILLNKQLKQKEQAHSVSNHSQASNEHLEVIQELNEKNQKLIDELKSGSSRFRLMG